ncbi:MAG: M48 family metallopeptidase [Chloroflexi bacterium]|nr:M48 family metallopeptidase [Chloroflexota bacterium]
MFKIDPQDIEIVRSARRSKTVTGEFKHGKLRVHVPARLTREQEEHYVATIIERVERRETQQMLNDGDPLLKRAAELNAQYFAGKLEIVSVTYVTNQNSRFGSCSVRRKTIRLSHHLTEVPEWVRDYVLMHEMAHLVEPGHNRRFWDIVNRYPRTQEARRYLRKFAFAE